jgi:hypothetical protein
MAYLWVSPGKRGNCSVEPKVCCVRGKGDIKTAEKLMKRIKRLGISYDWIATDGWDRLFLGEVIQPLQSF